MVLRTYSTSWTKNAPYVILSFVLLVLFVLPYFQAPLTVAASFHSGSSEIDSAVLKATSRQSLPARIPPTGKGLESISGKTAASPPPVNWDEQLGLTISQDSASLAYNITAVEQTDSDGYGPVYLLNGLSDTGNWYQVGLAYDWPIDGGGYAPGFSFLYESFNSSGVSVFPANGGGGLLNYSSSINEGDQLILSLNFTGSQVVMYSRDWNTGASASVNYTGLGGSIFLGLQTANNVNGFFSGLMTEQYHAQPYLGQEGTETYLNSKVGLNSGIMWIDEYNPSTNQTLFSGSSADLAYTNPNQLQYYSSNGTSEASDAYEFISGSNVLIPVTISYSIIGGGTGYKPPILNFSSDGQPANATLTTSPATFQMDQGTKWNVTELLNGSTTGERWITLQSNGTVSQTITIQVEYVHQFFVGFNVTPANGGSVSPLTSGWYEAGSSVNIVGTSKRPFLFSSWISNTTNIQFGNFTSANTTSTINGNGGVTAKFSLLALSLTSYSETVIDGSSISDVARINGNDENVSLSISGLPSGASSSWTSSQINIGINPVSDTFNITTSFSTPPGIYTVTVKAASSNSSGSVQFSLKIDLADPLTVSFSTNDDSSPSSPILTYIYNGTSEQVALTAFPQIVYADNGSSWSFTSSLNATSTQRWEAGGANQGMATGPATIEVVYYHQYSIGFTFGSQNNITSAVGIPYPLVSYTSGGLLDQVMANGTGVWADAGTAYNYSSLIAVSSSYRWETAGNLTGMVSESTTGSSDYLPQYLVNASYALAQPTSSSNVSSPELSLLGNGSEITIPLSESGADYWMNSGSSWTASNNLSSRALERWLGANLSGTVNSAAAIRPGYSPQFFVSISQNVPAAGLVTGKNGWYNINSTLSISASANQGWRFEMWTGESGTFNQSSTGLLVTSPLNETAIFYVSLAISPASGGQVSYAYGSTSGMVSGGSTTTMYLPPGTNVSLSAGSDSTFYSPGSWSVGNGSSPSSGSFALSVESPTSVSVSFNLNLTVIALIGLAIAGVLGSVVFVVLRRGGGRDMGGGVSHTWKW